jgi:hypothetical protein
VVRLIFPRRQLRLLTAKSCAGFCAGLAVNGHFLPARWDYGPPGNVIVPRLMPELAVSL